jgi:hypothetical protein
VRGRVVRHCSVVATVIALTAAVAGCQFIVSEQADPGDGTTALQILTPANHTQLAGLGNIPVDIRLGAIVDGSLTVRLFSRGNLGSGLDITNRFTIAGGHATATLAPSDFGTGFALLEASATRNAGGTVVVEAALSREPGIDTSLAARCEFLGQSRCLLPFPSDHFTVPDATTDTGRRVNLDSDSLPMNTNRDQIDTAEWNRNDGFSPGSAIVLHVPGVDLAASGAAPITDIGASLEDDSAVVLVDADTGERWPHFVELDSWATSDATRAMIIRPARNFREGARIVVGIRHLVDTNGNHIAPRRSFKVLRDFIPTYIPAIEQRRARMGLALGELEAAGVRRNDLYLAWDFTVASQRNLSERLLTMRDDAYDQIDDGVPAFSVTNVQENVSSTIQRRVTGTFSVPNYLTGTGAPGSRLNYGADGLPERNGTFQANFICNIAKSVYDGSGTVTPGRALVYGHGLLGSAGEVNAFGGLINTYKIVICGTDWVGMSTGDLGNVATTLNNLSNFPTLPDRLQQAHVNFQFLARLMKDPAGFSSHTAFESATGTDLIDTGSVFFNGNSQGGILGGAATAISKEWTRAVLGVPAMNFSTLLTRSVHWDTFSPALFASYPDELDHTISYTLIQMLWDRGEANGYAWHMTDDPLPGTPSHDVLLIQAFGDHQVANIATETEARTIGASVYQPALAPGRSPDVEPFWDIPAVPGSPFTGSVLVVWDYGTPPPPTGNLPPRSPQYGSDPHGKGAAEPRVGQQVDDFLRDDGFFDDRCLGVPCTSNV